MTLWEGLFLEQSHSGKHKNELFSRVSPSSAICWMNDTNCELLLPEVPWCPPCLGGVNGLHWRPLRAKNGACVEPSTSKAHGWQCRGDDTQASTHQIPQDQDPPGVPSSSQLCRSSQEQRSTAGCYPQGTPRCGPGFPTDLRSLRRARWSKTASSGGQEAMSSCCSKACSSMSISSNRICSRVLS